MNNIKILIVEDETIVALDIKRALIQLNYTITDTVTTYDEALTSVKNNQPDIVLMDIHLENSKDGIETAQAIQALEYNIPIIYLTAFSDDKTISRAIATHPIGYLIKPFKREELKTTIILGLHKLNKHQEALNTNNCIKIGEHYFYDLENESLFYNNMPVKLSFKESQLIKILVEANEQVVPFPQIEYLIWANETISDSTLRTLIYRTRAKLDYKFIETIPSMGCKLTLS